MLREGQAWQAPCVFKSESFAEARRVVEVERECDEVLDVEPSNIDALTNRAEVRLLTRCKEAAHDNLLRAPATLDRDAGHAKLRGRVEQSRISQTVPSQASRHLGIGVSCWALASDKITIAMSGPSVVSLGGG